MHEYDKNNPTPPNRGWFMESQDVLYYMFKRDDDRCYIQCGEWQCDTKSEEDAWSMVQQMYAQIMGWA